MTEDEARKKWCPMARLSNQNFGGSWNRAQREPGEHDDVSWMPRCIASDCMAWRWYSRTSRKKQGDGAPYNEIMAQKYPDEYELAPATGFCGLAGIAGLPQ